MGKALLDTASTQQRNDTQEDDSVCTIDEHVLLERSKLPEHSPRLSNIKTTREKTMNRPEVHKHLQHSLQCSTSVKQTEVSAGVTCAEVETSGSQLGLLKHREAGVRRPHKRSFADIDSPPKIPRDSQAMKRKSAGFLSDLEKLELFSSSYSHDGGGSSHCGGCWNNIVKEN